MGLSPSDIQLIAAFVRTITRAPNRETIVSETLNVINAITAINGLRVVHFEGPSRWIEWKCTGRRLTAIAHDECPVPQKRMSTSFFEPATEQDGFISAPNRKKVRLVLDLVAPQLWSALLLRSAADRVHKLSSSESKLARATFRARDEERRDIARELHDDLGQSLASLNLTLKWAEDHVRNNEERVKALDELTAARRDVALMLNKVRDLSRTLYPRILETLGFTAAVKELTHQTVRISRLRVEFIAMGKPRPFEREKEIALYRCCQEAIDNVIRHAQASRLTVGVSFTRDEVRLTIEDNGKGFNPRGLYDPESRTMTSGFWTIRQRVSHIGGAFRVNTAKGRGTVVEMILPHSPRKTHGKRKDKNIDRG
jgi:signal transduction histidine kinase